jgi:DNA (cytosine-5)-methyltransferase 1
MKQQPYLLEGEQPPQGVTLFGSDGTKSTAEITDVAGSVRTKAPGSIENSSTTAPLSCGRVRRLTPKETERLQGFPDNWTLVPKGKKMMADGPRYRMVGNSMAVPVMRWIGERIQMVREVRDAQYAAKL